MSDIEHIIRLAQDTIDRHFVHDRIVSNPGNPDLVAERIEKLTHRVMYHADLLGKALSELWAWRENELMAGHPTLLQRVPRTEREA